MKNTIKNGLLTLAAGLLLASCAEYKDSLLWSLPEPEPEGAINYNGYAPIKTYIDQAKYPNFRLGATVSVDDFNEQALAHAAVVTNFDEVAFGPSMMPGAIYTETGMMDFIPVRDLLEHVDSIGYSVFGSPLASNANQADAWMKLLTAPIEIEVPFLTDISRDYSNGDEFDGTISGTGSQLMSTVDGMQVVEAKNACKITLVSGFEVDPELEYQISLFVRATKNVSLTITFADNKLATKQPINNEWNVYVIKAKPESTNGYLLIDPGRFSNGSIYYSAVTVGHYPDNHRPQTDQELKDTLNYAINTWCDGLMKVIGGRIKAFDLIEDAIDENVEVDGHYDLKHSADYKKAVYWQDALGSENYAPVVAAAARKAYETYDGNLSELKLFVSESNLDNPKKLESLNYWMNIWDGKGAKIEGISAKMNIAYTENAAEQSAKQSAIDNMFKNLAATGKLIRLSDFNITYTDAYGSVVKPSVLTSAQRDKIAQFYAYVIKSYFNNVPTAQQYGISKGSLADTDSDPVGLWSVDPISKDWVRTSSYAAFCDALSGE